MVLSSEEDSEPEVGLTFLICHEPTANVNLENSVINNHLSGKTTTVA